jgi:hypothetical protein
VSGGLQPCSCHVAGSTARVASAGPGLIRITLEDVARVRAIFASPPPLQPAPLTRRDAIALLEGDIAALRAQGYSLDQIATMTTHGGIKVTAAALKTDLSRARSSRGGGRAKGKGGATRPKTTRKGGGDALVSPGVTFLELTASAAAEGMSETPAPVAVAPVVAPEVVTTAMSAAKPKDAPATGEANGAAASGIPPVHRTPNGGRLGATRAVAASQHVAVAGVDTDDGRKSLFVMRKDTEDI